MDSYHIPYTFRDISISNPSYEELKQWQEISHLPLRKFFNTSGLLYRSLGLKDKLNTMTEEEQLQLLASDGMLVKRPLLITEGKILVGFKETAWAEQLTQNFSFF
jgi:arsenate reductase